MPETATGRFQCRHIFTDGRRCASPSLRREDFCYYHHNSRRPIPKAELAEKSDRKARQAAFDLPNPEDRSAIQHSIGEVLRRIAANQIDSRRAGLLLYGLQIASLNLPKSQPAPQPAAPIELVEEIVEHPDLGILAPESEIHLVDPRTIERKVLDDWYALNARPVKSEEEPDEPCDSGTLPMIQAAAASVANPACGRSRGRRFTRRAKAHPIALKPREGGAPGQSAEFGFGEGVNFKHSDRRHRWRSVLGLPLRVGLSLGVSSFVN